MILRDGGNPPNIWFRSQVCSASLQPPLASLVELCKRWHAETSVVCKVADCSTEVLQMECANLQIVAQRVNRWSVQVCTLQHRGCCDVCPFGLTCAADCRVPRCGVLLGNCSTIHSPKHYGGNGGLSHVVV